MSCRRYNWSFRLGRIIGSLKEGKLLRGCGHFNPKGIGLCGLHGYRDLQKPSASSFIRNLCEETFQDEKFEED
jgi:hypothetical protein